MVPYLSFQDIKMLLFKGMNSHRLRYASFTTVVASTGLIEAWFFPIQEDIACADNVPSLSAASFILLHLNTSRISSQRYPATKLLNGATGSEHPMVSEKA